MFIHGTSYPTNLHFVQNVRSCLLRHYTLDMLILIEKYLNRNIETNEIICNPDYSFTIKVKKNIIRRKSFRHEVTFYYELIKKAMYEFFAENREKIIDILYDDFGLDAESVYNEIMENSYQLCGLFNVYCLNNYVVQIHL